MSSPSTSILPLVGESRAPRRLNKVDLPLPLRLVDFFQILYFQHNYSVLMTSAGLIFAMKYDTTELPISDITSAASIP
jgi:hypothetical protein